MHCYVKLLFVSASSKFQAQPKSIYYIIFLHVLCLFSNNIFLWPIWDKCRWCTLLASTTSLHYNIEWISFFVAMVYNQYTCIYIRSYTITYKVCAIRIFLFWQTADDRLVIFKWPESPHVFHISFSSILISTDLNSSTVFC